MMNGKLSQTQYINSNTGQPSWDLDMMIDQVQHKLNEEVDPMMIRQTLVRILVKYIDVPIQVYIPIFACREAEAALKK